MKQVDQAPSRRWKNYVPLAVIFALFASALFALPATAQDTPICASADSDPDGDGWGWENNQSCQVGSGSAAPANTCDYSEAHLHGGWGWDPVAGESCEPVDESVEEAAVHVDIAANTCDYSEAEQYGGWGWDPVNSVSCEPVEHTPLVETSEELFETVAQAVSEAVDTCDYSEAHLHGGWGWDPVAGESCEPSDTPSEQTAAQAALEAAVQAVSAAVNCDYSQAHLHDGWGWNPVDGESCEPREDSVVAATDLEPPRLLAGKREGGSTILFWLDDPDNAVRYKIERDGATLDTVDGFAYVDDSAIAGVTHTYSVSAVFANRVSRRIPVVLPPRPTPVVTADEERTTAEEVLAAEQAIDLARAADIGQFLGATPPTPVHVVTWLFQRLNGQDPAAGQIDDFSGLVNTFLENQGSEIRLPNPDGYPSDSGIGMEQPNLADAARAEIANRIEEFHETYGEYPTDAELVDLMERVITEFEGRGLFPERGPGACEGGLSAAQECAHTPNTPGPCEGGLSAAESCTTTQPPNTPGPCEGGLSAAESCTTTQPAEPEVDPNDWDDDGVPNNEDDFPWDPNRQEEDDDPVTYTPSRDCSGSLDAAENC